MAVRRRNANKTMTKRITIKDVAKAANVTPQTVSRAMRNAPDISLETRERILEIAAKLNYVKNSTASALRSGSTRLIAVVFDNLRNVFFSIMADYIQSCLKERGYTMLTLSQPKAMLDEEAYMTAASHNVDGIISFIEPEDEISSLIEKYKVPVLLFGRRTEIAGVDYVYTDDVKGGMLAAKKLIDANCRKLLMISEVLSLTCAYDRFQGFKTAIEENGLKTDLLIRSGLSVEAFGEKIFELGKNNAYPDGIFCFNDMIAFETLFYIEKYNLPPVKIVGYDNIQEEIKIPKRLTSVGTDKLKLCERAVSVLLNKIENGCTFTQKEKADVFLADGTTT